MSDYSVIVDCETGKSRRRQVTQAEAAALEQIRADALQRQQAEDTQRAEYDALNERAQAVVAKAQAIVADPAAPDFTAAERKVALAFLIVRAAKRPL